MNRYGIPSMCNYMNEHQNIFSLNCKQLCKVFCMIHCWFFINKLQK